MEIVMVFWLICSAIALLLVSALCAVLRWFSVNQSVLTTVHISALWETSNKMCFLNFVF